VNRKPMKPLLIYNGHIIDPAHRVDEIGSLLLREGKVVWRGKAKEAPPCPDYAILDAEGLVVCPGFIDLHCHLRQPGEEEKETIATGTQAAARGGFTTVCCMPNTKPPLDSKAMIDYVKSVAVTEGVARVLPIGCVTRGRRGEELADLAEMALAGVIGFSDDGAPVSSAEIMRQALKQSRALGLPVINHCEDVALSKGGQMNEGKVAAKIGLKGILAEAEERMVARDLALLEEVPGARLHIAHVSTKGSVELIRKAKEKGLKFTAEVTPHHLTLTEERVVGYNTNAKVNPPLRTEEDIKALIQGLKDDVIDIIATDHAPHSEADKRKEFTLAPCGISVFETALGSLMTLVHHGELSLNTLIAKMTCEPAKILGGRYGKLGTLEVGASADVTIFDPEKEWAVNSKAFASKGRNTPLAGERLVGKVMATLYDGKLVYKDDAVRLEEKALAR